MEKINSLLMLKYMISEGFNPNNYEKILELLQSVPNSLSKELVGYGNPYLLSKKVLYHELDGYGLEGANGYLEDNEILVPKTILNDNRFLYTTTKRLFTKYCYGTPSIDEFGTVIFCHNGGVLDSDVFSAIQNSSLVEDKFFGFIMEKDAKRKKSDFMLLKEYVRKINLNSSKEYELAHETISEENKELFLIKNKK